MPVAKSHSVGAAVGLLVRAGKPDYARSFLRLIIIGSVVLITGSRWVKIEEPPAMAEK